MNRDQKAAVVAEIAEQIKSAEAVYAVDYRGISVPQAAALRAKLRDADATFRVVKNSLSELAADQADAASLKELLVGPTALTFVRGDAAAAAKALRDIGRETETLTLKGGLLSGKELSGAEIEAIAKLPSRDQLIGQLVGLVASPLSGLARTLNALPGGMAVALGQIRDQGLVPADGSAAPEPAPALATGDPAPADEPPAEETSSDEPPADEPAGD